MNNNDPKDDSKQKAKSANFIISMIILMIVEYLIIVLAAPSSINEPNPILKANIFLMLYLLIAYFVRLKPDYEAFFSREKYFQIIDTKKYILLFYILLLPGRYLSDSIMQFFWLRRSRK
jgi:hypothetical protein